MYKPAMKNPYILNFCNILIDRKGEDLTPDARRKLLHDMYRLFENMLGQNMVKALPDHIRKQYLAMCEDLSQLNYEKIGNIFEKHLPDHVTIMKQTMKEFAKIYMMNRDFDPKNFKTETYPKNEDNFS